jgi:TonB family protein
MKCAMKQTAIVSLIFSLVCVPVVPAQTAQAPATTAAPYPGYTPPQPDITEMDVRQRLMGKPLFLRGSWLDDNLAFNENGELTSHSATGSFTLCSIEIERVRLTRHTLQLEGVRYGIHFLGESPWPEQSTSFDRIRLTPKKKWVEITIDRPDVIIPKEAPQPKVPKDKQAQNKGQESGGVYSSAEAAAEAAAEASAHPTPPPPPPPPPPAPVSTEKAQGESDKSMGSTTVSSWGESAAMLRGALDRIFATSLDTQMVDAMPDYWQYFYHAQRDHKSIEPTDPSIVRAGPDVISARLLTSVTPTSNDYAQANEIAGIAIYKVILGPDGKPLGVAIYRPIGFGLDENAVEAIRKSTFSPATKDGKAVSSVFNLTVSFRIYSKMTSGPSTVVANADQH